MVLFITPGLRYPVLNDSYQPEDEEIPFTNGSSTQISVNGSSELDGVTTKIIALHSLATFLMCVFGIPGNLLVLVVYAFKMTTSTRVYMFALAVADLDVCITGIVLTKVALDYVAIEVTTFIVHMSVIFSAFILAFVSIERLLAVRRPHSFSLSIVRAKRALMVIAHSSALCATVLAIGRIHRNRLLLGVFPAVLILTTVLVIIVCYSLMAMTMLMKARSAGRNGRVATVAPAPGPSTGTLELTKSATTGAVNINASNPVTGGKRTLLKQGNAYKGVSLLFIITVAFIVCWMPQWMGDIGLQVPSDVERFYVLNSVINPFIYGALSGMFRDDVRQLFRRMRSKLATCC